MASQTTQTQTQQQQLGEREHQQPKSNEQHQEPSEGNQSLSRAEPSSSMKLYGLYYTASMTNAKLHLGSSTDPCIYYAQGNFFSQKPQIKLRSGDSKSAPIVAFAKIHLTSRHILIGAGDLENDPENKLVWEDLHREQNALHRSDYEFTVSTSSHERRKYRWRRDKKKFMSVNYDCVDEEGQVIAYLFTGGFLNLKKGGEIKVAESLDKGLEEFLLVSALAIWIWETGGAYSSVLAAS